jgi:hypothetical protein
VLAVSLGPLPSSLQVAKIATIPRRNSWLLQWMWGLLGSLTVMARIVEWRIPKDGV